MKFPHTYILMPYTKDRRERLLETMASIWAHTNSNVTPYSIVTYENDYIGYPNAILDMVEGIDGFVFMGASDLIHGQDWLHILWSKMQEVGAYKIVEPQNEIQHGLLVQHPLLHSDLVKKYFHREYFHFYCDNEMHERAVADGVYVYCPGAPMEHRHVINGKAQMDEGYKVVFDPKKNEKDRLHFEWRKANEWPDF